MVFAVKKWRHILWFNFGNLGQTRWRQKNPHSSLGEDFTLLQSEVFHNAHLRVTATPPGPRHMRPSPAL